jgi:uncharacterized protein (TIGR01777 family)
MKILISGASGLVGSAATKVLRAEGNTVAQLVRPGRDRSQQPGDVFWNPAKQQIDAAALDGFDAVIHLSGASIADGRWTEARKDELRSSRIDSTGLLVDALAKVNRKPRVLVAASAVGYYGDRGDEILTESSPPGAGFLADLAREWEAESARAQSLGIRTVLLRTGVVLDARGGALPQMLRPFRFGAGGRYGSGKQWLSWIALQDEVAIIRAALSEDRYAGPLNAAAPNPVRNQEMTRVIAATLNRPAIFPAPAFALRLALGEMADALLLASQRAVPERLLSLGFKFHLPDFAPALRAVLGEH